MTSAIACDVSEHQGKPADDTYPHPWLIFRACFGGNWTDKLAAANLAWATRARAAGRLAGFAVYVVYLPGQNAGVLAQLDRLGVPTDCPVMIDAEHWGGQSYQINGDHSREINQLATALRKRQGGRADLVWAYGNRGPDLAVWPSKPSWCRWLVASYGGTTPNVSNLLGWQYTDGQPEYDRTDLPHSSAPFGRCDHNVLYQLPEDTMDPSKLWGYAQAIWNGSKPSAWSVLSSIHQTAHNILTVANAVASGVADVDQRVAALQADVAALKAQGGVQINPADLPVSGTVHIGGTS